MTFTMESIKQNKGVYEALREYFLLFLATVVIWCITVASHRIYPFGDYLMDIGDMGASVVPVYTFWWDVLHGNASPFFDWHTGYGNNMVAEVWHFGLLSPLNLLFLLVKRSAIEKFLFYFLQIKLIAVSMGICFVLRRWFAKMKWEVRIAFCMLYTFSVFSMQYYYFPAWLDVVFLFPLVMYFYFQLMKEKKWKGYTICLFFYCIISFQHIYMLILLLIFLTGIVSGIGKKTYRNSLPLLLLSSAIAGILAAFIWLPGIIQAFKAARIVDGKGLTDILSSVYIFSPEKWVKLLNMGIPILFFGISVRRMEKKPKIFFLYMIGILVLPIFLESSNLLWHGGSYNGYTMRFAYMLTFWLIVAGTYGYLQIEPPSDGKKGRRSGWYVPLQGFLFVAALCVIFMQYRWLDQGITVLRVVIILTGTMGVNFLLWRYYKKRYSCFLSGIVFLQSLILGICMIKVSWSIDESYITKCNMIYQDSHEIEKPLDRIKSLDVLLNQNYPFIMGKNAVSNYLAATSQEQLEASWRMGYSRVGIRMCDYGGTLFTDALSGFEKVYSTDIPNPALYFPITDNIYGFEYQYGTGILIKDIEEEIREDASNPFVYQNSLTKKITGTELFDVSRTEGNEFRIHVNERSLLYLYLETGKKYRTVVVTDQDTGKEYRVEIHESGWQNGIWNLGDYENKNLLVRIDADGELPVVYSALLSLERFKQYQPVIAQNVEIQGTNDSVQVLLNNSAEGVWLFLPVYADKGWRCCVNGQNTEIEKIFSSFMAIPLDKGKNEIELIFRPAGMTAGIMITMVGIILFCGMVVFEKRMMIVLNIAVNCVWYMVGIVCFLFWGVFYVLPIVYLFGFVVKRIFPHIVLFAFVNNRFPKCW